MRIAVLAEYPLHLLPGLTRAAPGHFATWLPQLSAAFAEQEEFEIHWMTVTRDAVPGEPIRWRNQTFHCLHVPGRLRMLRGYFAESAALRARVDRVDPSLVHAWGTEGCYGIAGARCGRPWLLSIQGILREYLRRTRMHPLVYVQAIYEWLALRRADELCGESAWSCDVLRRLAPRARVHLVEYGVPEAFYEVPWEPDPTWPVAVFAGTPDRRKGLPDAVAAFADPSLAGVELQVIGGVDGAVAREWRKRSTPNVRWLGRRTQAETAAALARAWCLILPTRADTGPMVVKEARVIGLPVISTPHGGTSTYVTDGVNGFLREPGDVAGFIGALRRIFASVETARAMGAARWAEQRDYFRPERTAAQFQKLYRELTGTDSDGVTRPSDPRHEQTA